MSTKLQIISVDGPNEQGWIALEDSSGKTYSTHKDKWPGGVKEGELECEVVAKGDRTFVWPPKAPGGRGGGGGKWRPMTLEEALTVEKAKYPSFATSYAKDALVTLACESDKITADQIPEMLPKWAAAFQNTMLKLTEDLQK